MLNTTAQSPSRLEAPRGQVLVIFAFAFIAIIMMLALLFDGARGLVLRGERQSASDAPRPPGAAWRAGTPPARLQRHRRPAARRAPGLGGRRSQGEHRREPPRLQPGRCGGDLLGRLGL